MRKLLNLEEPVKGVFWPKYLKVANCYFIKRDDNGFDVVDTAVPLERWLIALQFERLKQYPKLLLLTHSHADHAGNVNFFKNKYGARVVCSQQESPYLSGEKKLKPRDYSGSPFFARMIQIGDYILGHPKCVTHESCEDSEDGVWKFILIEGHTPGSGAWLHQPSKSLFLGDCLLNCNPLVYPHRPGLHLPFKYFCEDWRLAVQNLQRLELIDFENAFFGHGSPLIGDAKSKILSFLKNKI